MRAPRPRRANRTALYVLVLVMLAVAGIVSLALYFSPAPGPAVGPPTAGGPRVPAERTPAPAGTPAPQGTAPPAGAPTGSSGLQAPRVALLPGCPAEGDRGDRLLNRLKNRTTAPPTYETLTVDQFLATFTPNLHTPQRRAKIGYAHLRYIEPREQRGITLVGYLVAVNQSEPESANCHDPVRRDFHVWVAAVAPASPAEGKALRAQAVIVEPTPPWQAAHDAWRLRVFQRLARDGAAVRISGWAMYDQEHPEQVGKTRATLWEVHPVTKIEVWSGGEWRELP